MLALDVRQHQGARDAVEHIGRRRTAAPLFEPRVPGGADIGALRHFLATQSGRSPACHRKAERRRIELGAAILQVGAKQIVIRVVQAHPVSHYTRIKSLLYHDKHQADIGLRVNREDFVMRVFVTGATGFIGSAIVKELITAGHRCSALLARMRPPSLSIAAGAEVHRGRSRRSRQPARRSGRRGRRDPHRLHPRLLEIQGELRDRPARHRGARRTRSPALTAP